MKRLIAISAISVAFVSEATAGGNIESKIEPVVVDHMSVDRGFTGFHAGLEGGFADGTDTVALDASGQAIGGFVAYLHQYGKFVFGAEIRGMNLKGVGTEYVAGQGIQYTNVTDARLLLGRVERLTHYYASTGLSSVRQEFLFDGRSPGWDMNGINIGLGIQTFVSNNMTVGLDMTFRKIKDDREISDLEGTLNTITVRLGWRF